MHACAGHEPCADTAAAPWPGLAWPCGLQPLMSIGECSVRGDTIDVITDTFAQAVARQASARPCPFVASACMQGTDILYHKLRAASCLLGFCTLPALAPDAVTRRSPR